MINLEDFEDLDMCPDCKSIGTLKLFTSKDNCKRCEGSGWLGKGDGWNKSEAFASGAIYRK